MKTSLIDGSASKCGLESLKGKKKVLCEVWLKESTCRHAAFREQVIQSLLFTQKESGEEKKPFHTAWMACLSSDDCYWEKQNGKGCVLIHFRHYHCQSLMRLMNAAIKVRRDMRNMRFFSSKKKRFPLCAVRLGFAMMPYSDGALNLIW